MCEQKGAAATFYPTNPENSGATAVRLRDDSSVFNAELEGILLALKKCLALTKADKKFIIYTDSSLQLKACGDNPFDPKTSGVFFKPSKNYHYKVK